MQGDSQLEGAAIGRLKADFCRHHGVANGGLAGTRCKFEGPVEACSISHSEQLLRVRRSPGTAHLRGYGEINHELPVVRARLSVSSVAGCRCHCCIESAHAAGPSVYLGDQLELLIAAAAKVRMETQDACAVLLYLSAANGIAACKPGFSGCTFINAAAESPAGDHMVRAAVERHRLWLRGVVRELLADLRVDQPASSRTS